MNDMNEHDETTPPTDDQIRPGDDSASDTITAVDDDPDRDVSGTAANGGTDDSPPPPPPGPGAAGPAGPTPPGPQPVEVPGLVRDPHATFGGVLSGIAHRYAWSVAAVRLAFVALLLVSFGMALLLYLAAWVIVPRATHWPPAVVRRRGERLSNRDLGLAVGAAGLVAFLAIGADGSAAVLVPLVLVGAGIWLLLQPSRDSATVPPEAAGPQVASFATPLPVGEPVPPRRRRRWIFRILLAGLVALVLAGIALVSFVVVGGGADGFNLTVGEGRLVVANYQPDSLDELPTDIDADVGAVLIDLTDIPLAEFAALDEPAVLDVVLDDGHISLTLPEGLRAQIDASVNRGDIDLSGSDVAGATVDQRTFELDVDDPVLVVELEVDDGDIDITFER